MPTDNDVRTIINWLSPDWVYEAAREQGGGDLVLGAPAALFLVQAMVENYKRFMVWRDGVEPDLSPLESMKVAYGSGSYSLHPLRPCAEDRELALRLFPGGANIPGSIGKPIRDPWACASLLPKLLQETGLNRAVLDGRVWDRVTPECMFNTRGGGQTLSYTYSTGSALKEEVAAARAEFKKLIPHPLFKVGQRLLCEWLRVGLLTSPAGAMVSIYDVDAIGWSALVPGNGIPLAFTISRAGISWSMDHRAFDGSHSMKMVEWLHTNLPWE